MVGRPWMYSLILQSPEGAKRIVHKFDYVKRLTAPILTLLKDWPEELRANAISLKEAEKEIKKS
jgi:hypothetical protein